MVRELDGFVALGFRLFAQEAPIGYHSVVLIFCIQLFTTLWIVALAWFVESCLETAVKASLETENVQHALSALLRGLCDAVAKLSPELQIVDSDSHLSRLLLKSVPSVAQRCL